ncbi:MULTISPECIES: helix-turn-helix transcriptional regulator [Photorhabdus]|uniref:Dna binding protein n=4 Tax=Photorhabdus TaxID=29487 RepID=C7BP39_PHOAA|nr:MULTISPECIES: AlpA family transcriptional regulator [Photorhabdus]RKS59912.1 AlpA family transcriptional regulator [Photorhabdus asymbiotica]RKS66931.1 AlpA family transcriptional regulator [Photorhabdus asymbiotica]TDB48097.1 AlpA family transcriptional regulator [Photorhabdus luminescens subsp. mexicana]TDB61324.1 AlpA family transcriptional regulator [Photorhabdus khanii subsp. guanajuatensis]CAQ83099.1 predicted phage transcriptional regulator [Photorhabdus asymbiotica]
MAETTLIRLADVMKKVGLKKSWIYHLMQQGEFPKSVSLGARSVAWVEKEIDEWIINKINNRKETQG